MAKIIQGKDKPEALINKTDNSLGFQILIEGESLEISLYIKIFNVLNELIEELSKIVTGQKQKSEIILLETIGSNFVLKSEVKTAKSLLLLFNEVWDFIKNFKFNKEKENSQNLSDSLTVFSEIQKLVDQDSLSQVQSKECLHMIKSRIESLITMKVLPKQIVVGSDQIEIKKILKDFEGTKLFSSGEKVKIAD